jgi:hypothetical protein
MHKYLAAPIVRMSKCTVVYHSASRQSSTATNTERTVPATPKSSVVTDGSRRLFEVISCPSLLALSALHTSASWPPYSTIAAAPLFKRLLKMKTFRSRVSSRASDMATLVGHWGHKRASPVKKCSPRFRGKCRKKSWVEWDREWAEDGPHCCEAESENMKMVCRREDYGICVMLWEDGTAE